MANQKATFGKRQREQNRKDKTRAKQERLAARRADNEGRTQKGPPIASFAEVHAAITAGASAPEHAVSAAPIAGPSTDAPSTPSPQPPPPAPRPPPAAPPPAGPRRR